MVHITSLLQNQHAQALSTARAALQTKAQNSFQQLAAKQTSTSATVAKATALSTARGSTGSAAASSAEETAHTQQLVQAMMAAAGIKAVNAKSTASSVPVARQSPGAAGAASTSTSTSTSASSTSDATASSPYASQIATDQALGYNIVPALGVPGAADGANGSMDRWDMLAYTGATQAQQIAAYNNAAAAYANPSAANPYNYAIGGQPNTA